MLMWILFALLMTVMLAIDLGLNRKRHSVSFREALCWSASNGSSTSSAPCWW